MKGLERQGISSWASGLAWAALVAGFVPALTGCNSITGVGDLNVANAGAGGNDGAGSGTGTGTSSSTSATSSSSGGTLCPYPMGSWTHDVGGTLAQGLQWQGMLENSDAQTTIKPESYLDCDGTKKVNAILIDTSATWCGACQQEAQELPGKMTTSWNAKGIKVLTLMIEGPTNGVKATYQDAVNWKTQFMLSSIAVGVDPGFSFAPSGGGSIGLPLQVVVDPRTMKVVDVQQGFSGDYSILENLATTNMGM